jgi:hypothetical protein
MSRLFECLLQQATHKTWAAEWVHNEKQTQNQIHLPEQKPKYDGEKKMCVLKAVQRNLQILFPVTYLSEGRSLEAIALLTLQKRSGTIALSYQN